MRIRPIALLAALLAATPLAAQPRPVSEGDVVRFSPEPRGVFTVRQAGPDSLVVNRRGGAGEELRLPVRGTLIRRVGGPNYVGSLLRGAAYGLAAGTVGGGIAGYAQGDDPEGWFSFTAEENAALGAFLGGTTGLVVGAVAGLIKPMHHWDVAAAPSARASVSPTVPDGRPGLVLSVTF
jgi:hypothetical protein